MVFLNSKITNCFSENQTWCTFSEMAIMSFAVLNVLLTFRSLAGWRRSATFFTYLVSHSSSSRENKTHLLFSCYTTSKKPFTSAQNSVLSEYKVQTMTPVLQPGSYLCCCFPWTLKFQHHREGAGVAATFQKVSSLKPFVRFYPLWNVFWAVPSKGISATQVTLSQCRHISQGKQNNPNGEAKEASLIIWLPSQSFPLLTHPKVRAFTRPLFRNRSCILSFTSFLLLWGGLYSGVRMW